MLGHCLFCHGALPRNQELEYFPVGRRVAYDPARGRLWAVCPACARWNLAPIEERWEALEELEKRTRDRGRLLVQTDNIGLLRAGELDVVRIGRAELREESWWRYGWTMRQRRKLAWILGSADMALWIGLSIATNGMMSGWVGSSGKGPIASYVRWLRFGSTAYRGKRICRCGWNIGHLRFGKADDLLIQPADDGLLLMPKCWNCKERTSEIALSGAEAEHALRRIMAWRNFGGATRKRVDQATSLVAAAPTPADFARQLAGEALPLKKLFKKRPEHEVALEIALNEGHEHALLRMEAGVLEARWREEEALASIVDRELTPI